MVEASRTARHRALALASGGLLVLVAVAVRLNNALRFQSDQGFDASFNWRYIYRMSRDWALPHPAAGWSTGDPPLYFFLSALVWRSLEGLGVRDLVVQALPLLSTLFGLAVAALAALLVRRTEPGNPQRAWLAGGLLLYLPAHIHMSAMVSEEMLAALFTSLAVLGLALRTPPPPAGAPAAWKPAAAVGLAGGLALLSKLSGALAVATAAATYALDGLRRGALRPAMLRVAAVLLVATLAGGWYFARNRILYGYLQPFGLPAHEIMFSMPPGERQIGDYLKLPLATWSDPQLLNPDLLHSVWGSTYVSVWFDGHRVFLPHDSEAVRRLGTLTLLLALLPTLAFAIGVGRGLRRAARGFDGPDLPLLLLLGFSLAGYAVYTWRNPWFAAVKGTTLLGASLPFAYYTSEVLAGWMRRRDARAWGVGLILAALVACVTLSGTFGAMFEQGEMSGLPWQPPEGS